MNNDNRDPDNPPPRRCRDIGDGSKLETLGGYKVQNPLRTTDEVLQVFRKYFPEVAAGTVEIVSLTRNIGRRCLLAVRSHDPNVSAVQACTFEKREQWNELIAELGGESPVIILWQPTPEAFIQAAFLGEKVILDPETRQAEITLDWGFHNLRRTSGGAQAERIKSEIAGLVSEVTGWKIAIVNPGNG